MSYCDLCGEDGHTEESHKVRTPTPKKESIRCKNCGADMKTKYLIRVIIDQADETARKHYEATSKKSIVGWIKHIVDNQQFEEIEIINLMTECQEHEEFYKKI